MMQNLTGRRARACGSWPREYIGSDGEHARQAGTAHLISTKQAMAEHADMLSLRVRYLEVGFIRLSGRWGLHQPALPGPPLKGPTRFEVTQPP